MKKILLLFTVIFVAVFSTKAQYVLSMDGITLGDNITITPDDPLATEIEVKFIFTNDSDQDANIKVARNEIEMTSEAESYFCWGACFPPIVDTSGVSMLIASGESSNDGDFSAHFTIGESGLSIISYTFFNIDSPEDSVRIVVYFDTRTYGLSMNGITIGNEITIVPENPEVVEIELVLNFTNYSDQDAVIKIARDEISMASGSESYFCWGACYPPNVDTSSSAMTISAGATTAEGDFSAHYTIGDEGISQISYTFYNVDNPDDAVTILVNFDTRPNGINDNIQENTWISELYPNPTTNVVNIDYNFPTSVKKAEVKVVNLVGSVVMEKTLDAKANCQSINVSELKSGIYFYSLFLNKEIHSTKKLIVK